MAVTQRPLESGDRTRYVTIEQMTASVGASGFPVETWATLRTVPMARVDVQGREQYFADQLSARYDVRWEMGYSPDMDPELVNVPKARRLISLGRVYDIVSASVIDRQRTREGIELMTLAKVDTGGTS